MTFQIDSFSQWRNCYYSCIVSHVILHLKIVLHMHELEMEGKKKAGTELRVIDSHVYACMAQRFLCDKFVCKPFQSLVLLMQEQMTVLVGCIASVMHAS